MRGKRVPDDLVDENPGHVVDVAVFIPPDRPNVEVSFWAVDDPKRVCVSAWPSWFREKGRIVRTTWSEASRHHWWIVTLYEIG